MRRTKRSDQLPVDRLKRWGAGIDLGVFCGDFRITVWPLKIGYQQGVTPQHLYTLFAPPVKRNQRHRIGLRISYCRDTGFVSRAKGYNFSLLTDKPAPRPRRDRLAWRAQLLRDCAIGGKGMFRRIDWDNGGIQLEVVPYSCVLFLGFRPQHIQHFTLRAEVNDMLDGKIENLTIRRFLFDPPVGARG